jgi:hypothetical protein
MKKEDTPEDIGRCSGHPKVPDGELHRLLRRRLELPEPHGSRALTDEDATLLESKVSSCARCRYRLEILRRAEALRQEEADRHLAEAANTARIPPDRMREIQAAYEEHFKRAFTLRANLTRPLSEDSSGLGVVGARELAQLRSAVEADDPDRLVSLLSSETSAARSEPSSAWARKMERLLEMLVSEVSESGDDATRTVLKDAKEFFVTNSQELRQSPLDVSQDMEKKHFVCFLILLGYQTLLRELAKSTEHHRAIAVGKPRTTGNYLDLTPLFLAIARSSVSNRRHPAITFRLPET